MLLVIRHKVMTMTEFYEADAFDIDLMLSNLGEVERDASERMRKLMWAVLAPYSTKPIEPEGIIRFSWENNSVDSAPLTTKEQFDEMCKKFNLKKL